jgi:hypothetical protein
MNYRKQLVVSVFALVVAGCAAPVRPIPQELQFVQADATPESSTIVGSQEDSSWADNFTAFILAVDGKRVMAGRKGWNEPLRISKGDHRITATFMRGVYTASANVQLNAMAGAAYELKYVTDVGLDGNNTYCDFWIADSSTGKPVTEIVRGPVSGGRSGGFVPIFIPAGR